MEIPTSVARWAAVCQPHIEAHGVPDELRQDVYQAAAYLVGPLLVAAVCADPGDAPSAYGRSRAWSEVLPEELRMLPERLAQAGISARVPGGQTPGDAISLLCPPTAPLLLPGDANGIAVLGAAKAAAADLVARVTAAE